MSTTEILGSETLETVRLERRGKIWIDLDNSPHVPFFRPIIDELKTRGYQLFITARDAYQVRELMEYYGVKGTVIGKHYGKHKTLKAIGTIWRAISLIRLIGREKPDISVCHGSRGCLIVSKALKIPSLAMTDYEFTTSVPWMRPTWLIVPSVVTDDHLLEWGSRMMKYPGIKEDVYLPRFRPDPSLRRRLGIAQDELMVTVRPPATEAHYHNPEAELLLQAALDRFVAHAEAQIVLLPRNRRQEEQLRREWNEAIGSGKIVIPEQVEDGMNLIWNSDLVISGGGTMNREAAAMGVPVYSIFRGKIGGVDRHLAEQGRLVLLESVDDVWTKIKPVHREKFSQRAAGERNLTLDVIVGNIMSIVDQVTASAIDSPNQVQNGTFQQERATARAREDISKRRV